MSLLYILEIPVYADFKLIKMSDYKDFFNELMKDPGVRMEYEVLDLGFHLVRAMIKARHEACLTQK